MPSRRRLLTPHPVRERPDQTAQAGLLDEIRGVLGPEPAGVALPLLGPALALAAHLQREHVHGAQDEVVREALPGLVLAEGRALDAPLRAGLLQRLELRHAV